MPTKKLTLYNSVLMSILIVSILIIVFSVGKIWKVHRPFSSASEYQAVFLDNGQVYFGSIDKQGLNFVELSSIYYLQLRSPLQGQDSEEDADSSDLSLIKLGNELHGPQDKMIINKDHILFIEDLKSDSKVVQAIRSHRAGS